MKLKRLCGHRAAPRNGLAHSATSVASHHANYGGPEARTDNPQTTALFPPCPLRFCLASFPLCALCAFVVKIFSSFDDRPTTNDDRLTCRNDATKSERVRKLESERVKDAHQCAVIALVDLLTFLHSHLLTVRLRIRQPSAVCRLSFFSLAAAMKPRLHSGVPTA